MTIFNALTLVGGLCLFLLGMNLMGQALERRAGGRLRTLLDKMTSRVMLGFLTGLGVTAIIQSSSATTVMVVGFVNSGLMTLRQAINVIMGANVGTTVTAWFLSLAGIDSGSLWVQLLKPASFTPVLALIGIIFYMFCKDTRKKDTGLILLGFTTLMFGMETMSGAVAGLRDVPAFTNLFLAFTNPLLGVLVGTVFTCILQSASAAVGILQALAITGTITFSVAFPITLGIAIGAAVPVLLSSLGASVKGKRTAYVYLLIDVIGALVWGVVFYVVNAAVHFPFMDATMTTVSIALLNTVFRFATVLLLTPMIPMLERLVTVLFPDKAASGALADMDRLEERFLTHPALAIEQSRLVTCSMAQKAQMNLLDAMSLRHDYSDEGFERVEKLEGIVDRYEDRLGTYLVQITRRELLDRQNEDVSKFLHTITDFERISDHALNIAEACRELHEKDVAFSPEAEHELDVMESAIREIVSIAIRAFTENDLHLAGRVEPLEEIVDGLCDQLKSRHVGRLQQGVCTLKLGFVFNDLLTNYERVADHCSNIAVALIELESDVFDTHAYLNSVHELKSETFDRYYDEYQKKFAI